MLASSKFRSTRHDHSVGSDLVNRGHTITQQEKTRLLLFTNSIAVGGMEEHVKLLARFLDREQFEVYAVAPKWEATTLFSCALAKAADQFTEITPDLRYGLFNLIKEFWRLYQQLRSWHIQVMHMHSTTYRGQIWALLAARLAGVRKIYVTEHLAPESTLPFMERLKRNIFSRAVNGIVCVSQKNYEARAQHIYTPRNFTWVVENGVDVDDFRPSPPDVLAELRQSYNLPVDAQIVGTVVRFEPEKGLNYLIDAMPAIKAACPNTYFLMVGDGSLREDLKKQVASLGLTDCVRFTGFQANPRPYLELMDAFVLPVPVGSMSIGLLEAMAMQKAVVITFGGVGEAVVDGESGFCAEPCNPAAIAQATIQILQQPGLKKRFGEAARQRIETQFSAKHVAEVLGKIYNRR